MTKKSIILFLYVSSEPQNTGIFLYVNAGSSLSFTLTVDSLEWVNVASGDQFIVTRGQSSTSATSHNQYAGVIQLGNFDEQPWITVPDYTWTDDETLTVREPGLVPNLNLNEIEKD
mgnify:CR=1 FL=1